MSEAVKAAIRAARQQQRARAASPTKQRDAVESPSSGFGSTSSSATPFRRNDFMAEDFDSSSLAAATEDLGFVQTSIEGLLNKACQNGRLNLSSRSPALVKLPAALFSLADDDAPSWFSVPGLRWWERQDLRFLIAANGEIEELDERVAAFRALVTLDLHNNRLRALPDKIFQLKNLTSITISHNALSVWPNALLALDNLVILDISHNKLDALWDDAAVGSAREQREAWDRQQQDDEHQGIWAGFGRDAEKERRDKEEAAALAAKWPRTLPFRALKTLNLASNKLTSCALGLTASPKSISWPPNLERLDISDNTILSPAVLRDGPFSLCNLPSLRELVLAGNGISDEVFRSETNFTGFKTLSILDLQRCEIDDLEKVEAFFDSKFGASRADGSQRELVRVTDRAEVPADAHSGRLHVLLEGNPLREEIFKQKRGLRSVTTTSKKPNQHAEEAPKTEQHTPNAASVAGKQLLSSAETSSAPKAVPVKEAWELEAEAGLLTEGQRRMARIQAARKAEAEAAAAAAAAGAPSTSEAAQEAPKRGVNKTGLSDWDGEPVLPKYLQRRQQQQPRGTSDSSALPPFEGDEMEPDLSDVAFDGQNAGLAGNSAGSTLANAKLSVKKKEALGQVPCKFFRSNGCSAGAACPFAHTLPGDGHQKAICAYWAKGQCKFGHKCALLHILPGQPVSMDRKNKRAAQQAQNSGVPQHEPGNSASKQDSRSHQRQQSKNLASANMPLSSQSAYPPPPMPSQHLFSQHAPPQFPSFDQLPNEHFPGLPPGAIPWFPGVPPQAAAALLASIQSGNIPPPPPPPLHTLGPSQAPLGSSTMPFEAGEVAGMDLPFGLPDDLKHLSAHGQPPAQNLPHNRSSELLQTSVSESQLPNQALAPPPGTSPSFLRAMAMNGSAQSASQSRGPQVSDPSASVSIPVGTSSSTRPVSVPFPRHREDDNIHSLSGSPALATRAFGTSPFSNPAGTSVFYSTSQDDGPGRAQPEFMRSHLDSARSMSRLDNLDARERWANAVRGGAGRPESHAEEADHETGEEFLPSSLSDLLTPAELERRKRSTSQTAGKRPLSFVGFSNLHAHHGSGPGHRYGQLSASSTSRLNGTGTGAGAGENVFGRSPSSVGRWPASGAGTAGPSPSVSMEASSSLQQLYGRTQTTPTRAGQSVGMGTSAGLIPGTASAADLLSSSPSAGGGRYQAPQSLPQSLANRMFLGPAAMRDGFGDEAASSSLSQGLADTSAPWGRSESGRGLASTMAPGSGAASAASAYLLGHSSIRSTNETRLGSGSRNGLHSHLGGGSYRPSSSTELLSAGYLSRDGDESLDHSGGIGSRSSMSTLTVGASSYDELGPVAPSSLLPHRPSPLSLASGIRRTDSGAHLPSSASGSFVSTSTLASTATGEHGPSSYHSRHPAQPLSGGNDAIGHQSAAPITSWAGIAIGHAGSGTGGQHLQQQHEQQQQQQQQRQQQSQQQEQQRHHLSLSHQQQRPSQARNAGGSGSGSGARHTGASNSPMAVPMSTKEEYEEAIFELE